MMFILIWMQFKKKKPEHIQEAQCLLTLKSIVSPVRTACVK